MTYSCAVVSYFLPGLENNGGPNALIHQIIKYRPIELSIDLYVPFDYLSESDRCSIPSISESLNIRIFGLEKLNGRGGLASRFQALFWPRGAVRLNKYLIPKIAEYDAVWGYPYWTAPMLVGKHPNVVISGMDSVSLLYWRRLKIVYSQKPWRLIRSIGGFLVNLFFEFKYLFNVRVHTVGVLDAKFLKGLGVKAKYIPHPMLDYAVPSRYAINQESDDISILISNAGDSFYGSNRWRLWIKSVVVQTRDRVGVRLLLHKCSPECVKEILEINATSHLKVEVLGWIKNYSELLSATDIQFFPLDIGAGTKTSVLTAVQHGVVCIGTSIAVENICLQSPESAIYEVDDGQSTFENLFNQAVDQVFLRRSLGLNEKFNPGIHDPSECSRNFWKLIRSVE